MKNYSYRSLLALLVLCILSFPLYAQNTPKTMSKVEALEDIKRLRTILMDSSAFACLNKPDLKKALDQLKADIKKGKDPLVVYNFAYKISKIVATLGDRHSRVTYDGFYKGAPPFSKNFFPIPVAPFNGKAVALKPVTTSSGKKLKGRYELHNKETPFIDEINGESKGAFYNKMGFRHKGAPNEAKLHNSIQDASAFGIQTVLSGGDTTKENMQIGFKNGSKTSATTLPFSSTNTRYLSKVQHKAQRLVKDLKKMQMHKLTKPDEKTGKEVAYFRIPEMISLKNKQAEFDTKLKSVFESEAFKNSKALVLDLRYNRGGKRDLISAFAPYIIPPHLGPVVSNVMFNRRPINMAETDEEMARKNMHKEHSPIFTPAQKAAIAAFKAKFVPSKAVDQTKFTNPYYFVLSGNQQSFYNKPIYILVNEDTFSAASVFTSVFHGLPNVKIVGVRTDGSSGNSRTFELPNSKIDVKVSRAASFQKNGDLFDGVGTKPDIELKPKMDQVLGRKDHQLLDISNKIKGSK